MRAVAWPHPATCCRCRFAHPASIARLFLSPPRPIATVSNPNLLANWTPKCPSPPIPCIATRSPGRAPLLRSALNVVMPAHMRWRGFFWGQCVGNTGQRLHWRKHELRVAAVVADTGNLQLHTCYEITPAARFAFPAVSAMPADSYPIADFPRLSASPTASITPAISCPGERG